MVLVFRITPTVYNTIKECCQTLLQVGMGGNYRTSKSWANVRKPTDWRVCMGSAARRRYVRFA